MSDGLEQLCNVAMIHRILRVNLFVITVCYFLLGLATTGIIIESRTYNYKTEIKPVISATLPANDKPREDMLAVVDRGALRTRNCAGSQPLALC